MNRKKRDPEGFSLLEVLVALSIVTMILFLSFNINSNSIAVERNVRQRLSAAYQAEKLLNSYISGFPDKGKVSGKVNDEGVEYSYLIDVSETPHPDALEVTVTLSWIDDGNPLSIKLTGLSYR